MLRQAVAADLDHIEEGYQEHFYMKENTAHLPSFKRVFTQREKMQRELCWLGPYLYTKRIVLRRAASLLICGSRMNMGK